VKVVILCGGQGTRMREETEFRPKPLVFSADRTPVGRAVAVGCCQALALVPGVSRSGATIIGGLLFGLERKAAAEFSLLPTTVPMPPHR